MVRYILPLAFVLSFSVNAQPDLKDIGLKLEQSGKRRNAALVAAAFTVGACLVTSKMTEETVPALAIGVIGGGITIGLSVSANNKEKRAGRLLQQ